MKTTEGIDWNWKRVGNPAIDSAATTPSRYALWASIGGRAASPTQ